MSFIVNGKSIIEEENNKIQQSIMENSTSQILHQLNMGELTFLLTLINQSTFNGSQLELVYNTVLKLQNQYIEQSK